MSFNHFPVLISSFLFQMFFLLLKQVQPLLFFCLGAGKIEVYKQRSGQLPPSSCSSPSTKPISDEREPDGDAYLCPVPWMRLNQTLTQAILAQTLRRIRNVSISCENCCQVPPAQPTPGPVQVPLCCEVPGQGARVFYSFHRLSMTQAEDWGNQENRQT